MHATSIHRNHELIEKDNYLYKEIENHALQSASLLPKGQHQPRRVSILRRKESTPFPIHAS